MDSEKDGGLLSKCNTSFSQARLSGNESFFFFVLDETLAVPGKAWDQTKGSAESAF